MAMVGSGVSIDSFALHHQRMVTLFPPNSPEYAGNWVLGMMKVGYMCVMVITLGTGSGEGF